MCSPTWPLGRWYLSSLVILWTRSFEFEDIGKQKNSVKGQGLNSFVSLAPCVTEEEMGGPTCGDGIRRH